ncbi:MAG: sulfite exporter TauE/SafE family protein [Candidatus Gracilibacteria bacterium]
MDLHTLIILGLGVSLGFFVQTVLGFASALVSLPIIMLVATLQEGIALLSIFLLIFSLILIYQNRKLIDKKIVLKMAIGAVIGFVIGVYTLQFGDPDVLKRLLGIFIICYVLYSFFKNRDIKIFHRLGFLFSFLGGFFSGLYSSGGPLFITFIQG